MLPAFKHYLTSLKLGPVSRKLYFTDVRRFFSWLASKAKINVEELTLSQVTSPKTYLDYLASLKSVATAPSMLKRTTASLRQFGTFLSLTYSIPNPTQPGSANLGAQNSTITPTDNYIKHFSKYLNESHLSPLTIKSYKSDITRYLDWTSTHLTSNKIVQVLNDKNIEKYLNHLSVSGSTLQSTIERKEKSLQRFQAWYTKVYSPNHVSDNYLDQSSITHDSLTSTKQSDSTQSIPHPPFTANPLSGMGTSFVKKINYRNLAFVAILLLFTATLAVFGYRQFNRDVRLTAAYPSTPVTPNRQLSFQGRLEDAGGTPITTATDFVFKLYDDPTTGTQLYSSGTCSIDPDSDGVFSTQIGSTCGAGITSDVFTQNADVWLEVTVGTSPSDEILDPRQQIATVAYALNSETIQGFPISSTVSAIRNTVVPMNQWGEIIVGEQSPRLTGVSGTFAISAPALTLTTTTGSNGNINLAPDGTGVVNVQGSTVSSTSFFNVSANQLSTGGTLIKGNANNDNTGFNLIDLFSGSTPTSKFSVDYAGNSTLATGADLIIGAIGLNDVGSSNTTSGASLIGTYDEFDNSASATVQDVLDDLDAAITTGISGAGDITAVGSMTSGDTFADSSADDDWLGLGASAGRIEFDDQTIDEVNILNARLGIGSTAPTQKLYVDGNIGITNSGSLLTDNGAGTHIYSLIRNDTVSTASLGISAYGGIGFATNETTGAESGSDYDMFITSTGNVGIGNTNPQSPLDVTGDIYVSSGLSTFGTAISDDTIEATKFCTGDGETNCATDFSAYALGTNYWTRSAGNISPLTLNDTISATTSASTALTLTQTGAFNALLVEDQASDTTPFVIDQSGNVGIGTTSPSGKLEIVGTADDQQLIIKANATQTTNLQEWQNSIGTALSWIDSNGNLKINTNSTSALIAEQDGVEDNTLAVDTTNGQIYINGSTSVGVAAKLNIFTETGENFITHTRYSDTTATSITNQRARGTAASPTQVVDGDNLGSFNWRGLSVTAGSYSQAAAIKAEIDGEPSTAGDVSDMPGRLIFMTTPDGSSTPLERMRVNNAGNVGIGTTSPDAMLDSLATSGEQLRLSYTDGSVYSGMTLNSSGNLIIDNTGTKTTITDDLEIVGDDLIMTTNTSGYLLIADGTNFNPTAVSGDITIDGTGATAIGADRITESMLKSVNGPTDELCLSYESTVGDFEWQTCGSGGGGSNWRLNAGTISPNNDTLDLLVGANATSSAKAGFININSGTPTATLSAGTTGGAYLTANGTLATTAKQTLTIGNSSTGNVVIAPGGVTALTGIGANLVAAGNLTLTAANNLIFGTTSLGETTAANDSGAYVVGSFDEFDNSNSLNVQDVLDDLDAVLTTALSGSSIWTDAGAYLYPTGGEVLGNSAAAGANKVAGIYLGDTSPLVFGTDNDFSFSFSGSTLGSTLLPGTMLGINTTTGLATLDVRSSLGTIPVASISGNTSMPTLIVDQSGIGDLFTASKSGDTKFVITNAGNVGIGVAAPTNKLEIGGSTSTLSNSAGDITIDSASNFISLAGDSLGNALNGYFAGEVGIGLSDAIAKLDVHGAVIGKALVMFNEIGDQDILTASTSGLTKFRLKNDGSLTFDGDYLNFALTDGTTGYGFRDNGGNIQFKHSGGSWADIGSGGGGDSWWDQTSGTLQPYNKTVDLLLGGTATSSAKFAVLNMNSGTPTASISGNVIIGQGGYLGSQYGPLNLAYKSAPNTWATGLSIQDTTGYIFGLRYASSTSSNYYLDPASTGTSLSIDGNIVGNGAFYLSTGADATAVSIGTTGAGKLNAGTIDPPYTINGDKFATYMTSMTGVKEETTGSVVASEYVAGKGYRATLDFANSLKGSDLWLFTQTTNLQSKIDQLVVLTTAAGNTRTWYELDAVIGKLYLYGQTPTTISYRLTAPRFDASNWSNTRDSEDSLGFVIDSPTTWSVPESIAALFNNNSTGPVSPLAEGQPTVITGPISITPLQGSELCSDDPQNSEPCNPAPLLTVEGEIDAATISARVAQLETIQAETITATNIVADTIEANHIIGLDAKIASLSAGMSDEEFDTITNRIKARLSSLTEDTTTAEDIPLPEGVSSTGDQAEGIVGTAELGGDSLSATSSATISTADIDFATINNYLAVIGQATITTLDVTNTLYATSISSKTGLLALAEGTMVIDATGQVTINGDLTVTGKILADSASLNTLEIGSPASASGSATALGQLLAIYNESGEPVATIDASGSANLDRLTTNMITIASPAVASSSTGLSELIGQASSNATAGVATLVTPNTELTIESPYVTPNSLVYLTPTGNTDNKVLFVQSKVTCPPNVLEIDPDCTPSFTVGIDTPATSDISFNWWIIELAPQSPATTPTEEQI